MNNSIYEAINICLQKNIPFVSYIMPNDTKINFFSNPTESYSSDTKFYVNFFADKSNDLIKISNEFDANETIKYLKDSEPLLKPFIEPHSKSTTFESYSIQISKIISLLNNIDGKIVLSRSICDNSIDFNWGKIALKYFQEFPSTFRYIYYTRQTGCWIGASPEIIFKHNKNEDIFETMSLAGTRKISSYNNETWDNKNKEEHDYVTRYIVNILSGLGLKPFIHQAENINFGKIEHLCNRITSTLNNKKPIDVIATLSPTPALAGYPIDFAIENITILEEHPRYCYGGYVAIEDSTCFDAYVNLRCVHFNNKKYCIYSGGGITIDSNATDEWDETESKAYVLKQILTQ